VVIPALASLCCRESSKQRGHAVVVSVRVAAVAAAILAVISVQYSIVFGDFKQRRVERHTTAYTVYGIRILTVRSLELTVEQLIAVLDDAHVHSSNTANMLHADNVRATTALTAIRDFKKLLSASPASTSLHNLKKLVVLALHNR
jgi:integral membrane sensor domain MASE1